MKKINKKITYKIVFSILLCLLGFYVAMLIFYKKDMIDEKIYRISWIVALALGLFLLLSKITLSFQVITMNIKEMNTPEYQEKLKKAMYKVNHGGDYSDFDDIVKDYYVMISKKVKGEIKTLSIDDNNYLLVKINGEVVDLGDRSNQNDEYKNCLLELQTLFNDEVTRDMIEQTLLQKFQREKK